VFNNITEVIKCKRCSSRLDLEVLACSDDGKLLDAVMNCVGCGAAYVVSEGVLLGLKSRVNEGRISAFNDKYGRSYTIGHSKSGYVEYVEKEQYPRKATVVDVFRKVLAGGYYIGVILLVAIFLRLFERRRPKSELYKDWARSLASEYYYVPEMAIQKIIEMDALGGVFTEKPKWLLDIGGGNGIVTNIFLGNKKEHCVNVDLFGVSSRTYDLVISDDIRSQMLNTGGFDGALSICVMEHIPKVHTIFPSIASLLAPGAIFAFTTPMKNYTESLVLVRLLGKLAPRLAKSYKKFDMKKSHHVSLYEKREMVGHLDMAGFSSVSVTPFYKARRLFIYDLINLPAKLPSHWYFWAELKNVLDRVPFLKRVFCRVVYGMLLSLNLCGDGEREKYTHYLYVCKK